MALRKPGLLVTIVLFALTCLPVCAKAKPLDFFADLRHKYELAQANQMLNDEIKIKNTVETYLAFYYGSVHDHKTHDFGFLFSDLDGTQQGSYKYQFGRLGLQVASVNYYGIDVGPALVHPEYTEILIAGDSARVLVYPFVDLSYNDVSFTDNTTLHEIFLTRGDGPWRIRLDSYSDEFTDLYPADTDFTTLVTTFKSRLDAFHTREQELLEMAKDDPRWSPRVSASTEVQSVGYIAPMRSAAVSYARAYTEESGDYTHDTYNTKFRNDLGNNDCQNYVSQCIWYMFGGVDWEPQIQNHYSPMVYNVPGATSWWCDSTNSVTTWTYVPDFFAMVTDNYNYDKVGVQGTLGNHIWMYSQPGDYVKTTTNSHVLLISNTTDLNKDNQVTYADILVCAHTVNHKDKPLSAIYYDDSTVYPVWIIRFKQPQ